MTSKIAQGIKKEDGRLATLTKSDTTTTTKIDTITTITVKRTTVTRTKSRYKPNTKEKIIEGYQAKPDGNFIPHCTRYVNGEKKDSFLKKIILVFLYVFLTKTIMLLLSVLVPSLPLLSRGAW